MSSQADETQPIGRIDNRASQGSQFGDGNVQINRFHDDMHGSVSEHARLYQQGPGGLQFNGNRIYFSSPALQPWLIEATSWPLVGEWDPLELGVHRASIANGNAVPPYIRRDKDQEILDRLSVAATRGGLVLIVGHSTAGKTRAAYEAVQRIMPERRLFAPGDGPELREAIISIASMGEGCVVWLDDLERFLGADGLTQGLLTQLRIARVTLLATMRTQEFRRLTTVNASDDVGDRKLQHEMHSTARLLSHAGAITLDRKWSGSEIDRARQESDVRVARAIEHHETYGLAEYMAAGPTLHDQWRMAWGAGENPRGAALVAAAIDCTRAGMGGALSLALLKSTHGHYLDAAGGDLLQPESFPAAVAWATQRRLGVASFLLPTKDKDAYRVFDYLLDISVRTSPEVPVPDEVWERVMAYADRDPGYLPRIGKAAHLEGKRHIEHRALKILAEDGSPVAAHNFAIHLQSQRQFAEAETWYRRAVEAGNLKAARNLGLLLENQHKLGEALKFYEAAACEGIAPAMVDVARVLQSFGRYKEAQNWLAKAEDRRADITTSTFGLLLAQSEKFDEAEATLRAAADDGDVHAMSLLGNVLDSLNRAEEAEQMWRRAIAGGNPVAMANLGLSLAVERPSEAEELMRQAIEGGFDKSLLDLARLLVKGGRIEEAREYLADKAENGNIFAAHALGVVLTEAGQDSEAESWLCRAVESNVHEAKGYLAAVLDRMGREDEALVYWLEASEVGDPEAAYLLGMARKDRNERELAREAFLIAAAEGHTLAACELGHLYLDDHDESSATEWLQVAVDAGHGHAACTLGLWLAWQGKASESEVHLRFAYTHDHTHVAAELARVLAIQGRGKEAAEWLRRSRQMSPNGGRTRQAPPKRKKRRRR